MSSLVKVRGYATASPPNARSIGPDVTPHRITTEAPGSSARSRAASRERSRKATKGDEKTNTLKEKTLFPLRGGGVGGGRGGGRGVRLLRVALVIVALGLLFPPPASAAAAAAAAVRGAARRALHVRALGAGDVDGFRLFVVAGFDVILDNLLLFRSFRRRVKTRRWREGRRSVRGAPAQRGGDDSVRRDSRKNNGIGRARTDSPRKTPFAVARGVENRKPKRALGTVTLSPPRGADGDAGEPSKRRDRAYDAGARVISRRSKPRASPVSCLPCSPVSCGRARFGAARERRVRARAPVRARAKRKARKSPKFREREKTEGTRGWRVAPRTSRRERNPSEWIAVWCTKISSEPSSGVMNPKPFWVLNHFTCARRRQEGASGNARSKPSKKNPSVVVKNIRGRERSAARRRGSARVASEEDVRHAVRRRRHTLPVSFVIVFRGGNCDWRERRAYAMAVGGCFRRDKCFFVCCVTAVKKANRSVERGDAVTSPFREDIFAERHR